MMDSSVGWLLDVAIEQGRAIIWIKRIDGKILRLIDTYRPHFYLLPKNENTGLDLFHILSQQPKVKKVEWKQRYTNLFDCNGYGKKRLICIYPESVSFHKALVKSLEKDSRVAQLFNTDTSHVQQYLFTKLKIAPTSKVEVQYDKNESKLIDITRINEDEVQPPPFSILYFHILTSSYDSGLYDVDNPIREIRVRYYGELEISLEGSETTILKDFCKYVLAKDPDILVSTNQHSRSTSMLEYLFARISELEPDLHLGRDKQTNNRNNIEGRIYLDNNSSYSDIDLMGLIEKAQFSFVPLGLAARYGMTRLIDSRNCYELVSRDFVIPCSNNMQLERVRTVEEIITSDKGGIIFSPQVGLHEYVAVLDYENEYANLIIRHNLSYESVTSAEDQDFKGLLPSVLESVLSRRTYFKNLQKSFLANTKEWLWCEQRIAALKSILVSLYGTTGSFWNRLANVQTFEEINRLSREVLIKTKDIVQRLGFDLIYADTDSVFLKKDGASPEDFESVRDILAKEAGLPISIENYYRFLVLLPLEADEKREALKHYFGITQTNELITRGIEVRRHDTPNFIKDFQSELLYTLFDCSNSAEVLSKGYDNALLLLTKTIDKVMTGEIPIKDLVVSKLLRQDLDNYRILFPHVSAALQMSEAGISLTRGDTVQYIYSDATHTNPLCRVTPIDLISEEQNYDKEKYRDMLLESAETVLGYFGFDRTLYGYTHRNKYRKWWYGLKEERKRDIETERNIYDE